MLDGLKRFEIRPARRLGGERPAGFDRGVADRTAQNLLRLRLADRLAHLVIDRGNDRGLDPPPGENSHVVSGGLKWFRNGEVAHEILLALDAALVRTIAGIYAQ